MTNTRTKATKTGEAKKHVHEIKPKNIEQLDVLISRIILSMKNKIPPSLFRS
jgi:hypothetical protein